MVWQRLGILLLIRLSHCKMALSLKLHVKVRVCLIGILGKDLGRGMLLLLLIL